MQTPSFRATPAYETEGFASRRGHSAGRDADPLVFYDSRAANEGVCMSEAARARIRCKPLCFSRSYCGKQGGLHERGGPRPHPMQTPAFSTILVQQMRGFAFLGPGAQQIEGFASRRGHSARRDVDPCVFRVRIATNEGFCISGRLARSPATPLRTGSGTPGGRRTAGRPKRRAGRGYCTEFDLSKRRPLGRRSFFHVRSLRKPAGCNSFWL